MLGSSPALALSYIPPLFILPLTEKLSAAWEIKKKVNKWLRNPSSGAGGIQSGVTRLQINAIYTACIASRRETNSVVDSATRWQTNFLSIMGILSLLQLRKWRDFMACYIHHRIIIHQFITRVGIRILDIILNLI